MLVKEGFKITDICKALNMARSSFYALIGSKRYTRNIQTEDTDDEYTIEKIKQIVTEHPYWGYRQLCAWLNHREHIKINKKKVYHLMKECALLGIKQAFTSYNNPKGNADTERFIRTLKEELIWLVGFESVEQAKQLIAHKIEEYNNRYEHSALGYLSPEEFTQVWTQQNFLIMAI